MESKQLTCITTRGHWLHCACHGVISLVIGRDHKLAVLTDLKANYWESFAGWNLTKFDGTSVVI